MLTLFYSPHMTSIDNEAGRASGHADVPLSETGQQRARELAQHYAMCCSSTTGKRSWSSGIERRAMALGTGAATARLKKSCGLPGNGGRFLSGIMKWMRKTSNGGLQHLQSSGDRGNTWQTLAN
ncbi:MAG TPA: histidine phosphatase family protein [Ktedonosporobacter sp.]|nr:histidine phosphatase family protein [Ktedonosporobacter sp.]